MKSSEKIDATGLLIHKFLLTLQLKYKIKSNEEKISIRIHNLNAPLFGKPVKLHRQLPADKFSNEMEQSGRFQIP